ncbi:MAG: putative lipid II flippase FtsW [Betaproteobacteria bacterium]|nr:putative lipid II flippase FtsW [Betaproteobacteria bacterium]
MTRLPAALRAPRRQSDYDAVLFWIAACLLAFGLVMVYSASIAVAGADRQTGYHETYFLVRDAVFIAIGVAGGVVAYNVPMRLWQSLAPYAFLGGGALLIIVLIPGIGRHINGSQRWLPLFVVNLQPSELMKLFVVLYAADYTVRKAALLDSFKHGFLPMLVVMLAVGGLLLREPDFGAFVVIASIAMSILFLGGINVKQFVGLVVLLLIGFVLLIWSSPYRMQRVIGFMNPWSDPFGSGYQLTHALIALGRGGWFGVGLGQSVEKLFYLPEAYADFLLAVIGEELGFLGVTFVIVALAWFVLRAFQVGREAAAQDRPFSALVAQGISVWIAVQAFINIGANMGLVPTKGLTLPFLSFGGSGMVTNCVALGILMRVDWETRQLGKGYST